MNSHTPIVQVQHFSESPPTLVQWVLLLSLLKEDAELAQFHAAGRAGLPSMFS